YLGKYEVTQEQYQQVMGKNHSRFQGQALPVGTVSWDEAQEFCQKASKESGLTVRLPTEAEWEYACRAGTRSAYYSGDSEAKLDQAAWYYGNSKDTTHPVGQKEPNAWGVYDLHGNVWEWCQNWHEAYIEQPLVNPQGSPQG